MRIAIMQPYFAPYIGYFQLIASVDEFIVYDDIQYTKKGWINRNRFLSNGQPSTFSVPLASDSDYLDVRERLISPSFTPTKLLNQLESAYRRAPQFAMTIELVRRIVLDEHRNLFEFIHHSLIELCAHLHIDTPIRVSSTIGIDRTERGQDKVLSLCRAVGATTYINASGGVDLYSKADFSRQGIDLKFLAPNAIEYPQFGDEFVPWLSIIDVLMFNPIETVRGWVATGFEVN